MCNLPDCTKQRYKGGQDGFPGSFPHKNGLIVPVIAKGWPAGHKSFKLLARLHVGIGGQGSVIHFTSCGWQASPPGHWTPSHGSRHWQIGQPLLASLAKPDGQNIRHDDAEHGDGAK